MCSPTANNVEESTCEEDPFFLLLLSANVGALHAHEAQNEGQDPHAKPTHQQAPHHLDVVWRSQTNTSARGAGSRSQDPPPTTPKREIPFITFPIPVSKGSALAFKPSMLLTISSLLKF